METPNGHWQTYQEKVWWFVLYDIYINLEDEKPTSIMIPEFIVNIIESWLNEEKSRELVLWYYYLHNR